MNMVDVKKVHRGVLLWREDILKSVACKENISTVVRDMVHERYKDIHLSEDEKKSLQKQLDKAKDRRHQKNPNAGTRTPRVLSVDSKPLSIPKKVIKNAKFVKEQKKESAA